MSDVFVSYKAEDRGRIRPLVQCLQSNGYSVWWDEQIGAGDAWRETIERELDAARCVVVIWSKRSVGPEGAFVREEATRAQRRGVYLPVLIDAVNPPLGFGEKQATSLRSWKGDCADSKYQAVLSGVRRIAGARLTSEATQPLTASPVSRRVAIAGAAIAAVAVSGFGVWRLMSRSSASTANSIAVLPFANLSGDPKQAYFSDGVAEEIRSALTRLGGLTVIGSSSSEAVRNDDAKTAAAKLGVANILAGSVRESPSTIRITAELIDGHTGADRWSQNYDRSPGDTIKIQTDIAQNVASALKGALGLAARAAISIGGTQNVEAQKLVLQSQHIDAFSRRGLEHALELLNEAIALDPNYAEAIAHKAHILDLMASRFPQGAASAAAVRGQAEQFAKRAIELAPRLASAHITMAAILWNFLRFNASQEQFQQALALVPDDPAVVSYGATAARNPAEAVRFADKAVALDPLNGETHALRAFALGAARRFSEALAEEQRVTRQWPDHVVPLLVAQLLMHLGRDDEAPRWLARADPTSPIRLTIEAILSARKGDVAGALAKKARVQQLYGDAAYFHCAQIDAQLGRKDDAFADLEHAWDVKDSGLAQIRWNSWLDPLHSDPRYTALIKKMNFPN
jgi:TolB-like protein